MHVITWITVWRPLNGRLGLRMAAWLQVKVPGRRLSLQLLARSVCDTKALLQLQYPTCCAKYAFASIFVSK